MMVSKITLMRLKRRQGHTLINIDLLSFMIFTFLMSKFDMIIVGCLRNGIKFDKYFMQKRKKGLKMKIWFVEFHKYILIFIITNCNYK